MKHVLSALGLLVCLVASGVLLDTAPDARRQQSAMLVRAVEGESTLAGRNLDVTLGMVRVVDLPVAESGSRRWEGATPGTWVAVDVSAECVYEKCSLGHASLVVGDESWSATERTPYVAMQEGESLLVQIPREGTLLFEVPQDVVDEQAELRLAVQADTRLDSLLVFPLDLPSAARLDTFEITRVDFEGARE